MFYCKNLKLANYLLKNGSTLVRIDPNPNDNRFLVFIFKQDDTIGENLQKWKTEKDTFTY